MLAAKHFYNNAVFCLKKKSKKKIEINFFYVNILEISYVYAINVLDKFITVCFNNNEQMNILRAVDFRQILLLGKIVLNFLIDLFFNKLYL